MNRQRSFHDNTLLQDIFNHVILKSTEKGLVPGESAVSDGTFIPAKVSGNSKIAVTQTVLKSNTEPEQRQPILSGILSKYAQMWDNGLQSDETIVCNPEQKHVFDCQT